MPQTNLQIITYAFQKAGIIDEYEVPTAAQGVNGLQIMNDYLATQARDGMRLGWYPQTSLTAYAPLQDADIGDVKWMLAGQFAIAYGVTIDNPVTLREIDAAVTRLTKRSIRYFESDLGELSRAQGGPWGGPGCI